MSQNLTQFLAENISVLSEEEVALTVELSVLEEQASTFIEILAEADVGAMMGAGAKPTMKAKLKRILDSLQAKMKALMDKIKAAGSNIRLKSRLTDLWRKVKAKYEAFKAKLSKTSVSTSTAVVPKR